MTLLVRRSSRWRSTRISRLDAGRERGRASRARQRLTEPGRGLPRRLQEPVGRGAGDRRGDEADRRAGGAERRKRVADDHQRARAAPARGDELLEPRRPGVGKMGGRRRRAPARPCRGHRRRRSRRSLGRRRRRRSRRTRPLPSPLRPAIPRAASSPDRPASALPRRPQRLERGARSHRDRRREHEGLEEASAVAAGPKPHGLEAIGDVLRGALGAGGAGTASLHLGRGERAHVGEQFIRPRRNDCLRRLGGGRGEQKEDGERRSRARRVTRSLYPSAPHGRAS